MISMRFAIPIVVTLLTSSVAQADFVKAEGTKLKVDGSEFRFAGGNSFSTTYSKADADEQMRLAEELGLNALRIWGFWNGGADPVTHMDPYGRYVLQSRPGVFPEEGWRRFDYVVYQARMHNLKLIIPLLNEWREFGGMTTYMQWAGLDVPPNVGGFYAVENATKAAREKFWSCGPCKDMYKAYINYVLNRVNIYTGVAYKDEPTIMIWEVMNEPRFGPWNTSDPSIPNIVAGWINELAGYIKSIDKNHLVGTGEEGFLEGGNTFGRRSYPWTGAIGEGVSFSRNAALPNVDVLSIHSWPFQWAIAWEYPDLVQFMPEWIAEHVRIAKAVNKPLYLGEFGWQILRRPGSDVPDRDRFFKATFDYAATADIAGVAYWHMTALHDVTEARYVGPIKRPTLTQAIYEDTPVPHDQQFRFDIYCPEDISTCQLIENFSGRMTSGNPAINPAAANPCKLSTEMLCGGVCLDISENAAHCGDCAAPCAKGQVCSGGVCEGAGLPGGRAPRP